ncbi:beta-ketoacyl-[acyl-carrier-protein] synthase family protein [Streptomyces roseoverticillatus]|uniref:beta-ketoacyl-[acyl-carrier-protein] synthase family protein n=1 Tax=Streptomyces roseoverticillatus TaxID=66429 RepID=UPI001F2FEA1F|nr:beta-ketoacyl-[acyl-carrier-protein] synthase family protein [Streptomyces roseoverticillatus]MCF3105447.1 beta-ketoacyl-[acyl-carrier-protein] synthase family protein [Streptomyces roseoverticillatus]
MTATTDHIAVTGLGLITPAGDTAPHTWEGLCRGAPTATPDPALAGLPTDFSCRATMFDADTILGRELAWRMDRFSHLAITAAREATVHAGLTSTDWDPTRVGIVIGIGGDSKDASHNAYSKILGGRHKSVSPSTIPRTSPNMAAGEISLDLGIQGPSLTVCTACASGATALAIARDLLRSRTCDIVLAGGADAATNIFSAVGFGKMQALSRRNHDPAGASRPFDTERDGFVLSEGAAVLVLENSRHARARRARIHAYLAGASVISEAHHITAPTPDGSGAARAIRAALTQAGLSPCDINHVNVHATSTRAGDLAEARALRTVFPSPPPVTANKSVIGHSIAAAGAIEAAVTVQSLIHQTIPPTANLDRIDPDVDLDVITKAPRRHPIHAAVTNSFGFGGQNTVLVFTAS